MYFIYFREGTKATGGRQKFQEKVTAYSCKNDFILVCSCRRICTVISATTLPVYGGYLNL
jgi:hypothetical protein